MLADISSVDAIYIVCGRTDMRKSIDGLCAIIQEQFSMEICLLYTSPSPRDAHESRMPSSA